MRRGLLGGWNAIAEMRVKAAGKMLENLDGQIYDRGDAFLAEIDSWRAEEPGPVLFAEAARFVGAALAGHLGPDRVAEILAAAVHLRWNEFPLEKLSRRS